MREARLALGDDAADDVRSYAADPDPDDLSVPRGTQRQDR